MTVSADSSRHWHKFHRQQIRHTFPFVDTVHQIVRSLDPV